jgi:hypothetical protein
VRRLHAASFVVFTLFSCYSVEIVTKKGCFST